LSKKTFERAAEKGLRLIAQVKANLSLLFIASGPPTDPSPPPAMRFSLRRR
jgi:hypothetical protein